MSDSVDITVIRELFSTMTKERADRDKHFDDTLKSIKLVVDNVHQSQLVMNHDLAKIEEIQSAANTGMRTDILDLQTRVRILERFNDQNYGAKRANDKTFNWWSDNWFKIVSLFVLAMPAMAYIYNVVKG